MVPEGGECTHRTELTAPPPFDELYNEYKDRVFCFAYYLTQNRGEAEDLFQEACGPEFCLLSPLRYQTSRWLLSQVRRTSRNQLEAVSPLWREADIAYS